MADQYTLAQFGQRIKQKYPQYSHLPDEEIARKVLAKYPQYQSSIKQDAAPAPAPRLTPEPRTAENYVSEAARGVGRGLLDDVSGIYSMVRHPGETAKGMAKQLSAAQQASDKEFNDLSATYPSRYSPTRNLASMLTFAENAPIVGSMVQRAEQGGTTPGSPESVGAAFEGTTSIEAPGAVGKVLGLAPRMADAVTGTGPRVVDDLVKDTESANKAGAVKVAEANHAAAMEHLENTRKALHETAGRELTYAEALKAAQEEAAAMRKAQLTEYLAEKAKAEAQRQAAQEKFEADRAAQRKIEPQKKKLENAQSALRAAVETAREKALKAGNEKYNTVNPKLNPIPADMETVHGLYHEAAESLGEVQVQPALLNRLGKSLQNEGEFTYKDEQALYSELGKELSKGTLPGPVYHAYDLLHEGIGKDMQRIADSQGIGEQLADARNYWRRMKQTFGKPVSFRDAASKAMGSLKDEVRDNQIRLLGSFDPKIPGLFQHVENVKNGADSLPKPVPERVLTQKLAESRPPLPARPEPIQPKWPAPIERVAPPDRPAEILPAPRKIGAEDVQAAKAESMAKAGTRVRNRIMWAAVTPTLVAIEQLVRLHGLTPGEVGAAAAGTAGMAGVAALAGRLFENPSFVEFMTKATPRDVASIPPELRGEFPQIVKQAQARGIKVSPILERSFQGTAALAPRRPEQNPTDAWQGIER